MEHQFKIEIVDELPESENIFGRESDDSPSEDALALQEWIDAGRPEPKIIENKIPVPANVDSQSIMQEYQRTEQRSRTRKMIRNWLISNQQKIEWEVTNEMTDKAKTFKMDIVDELPQLSKENTMLYANIVQAFKDKEKDNAKIVVDGITPASLQAGLRRIISDLGTKGVRAVMRNKEVYLTTQPSGKKK